MAFKMKGRPMFHGSKVHKKALKLNRAMDKSSLPGGRAKSSAFQKDEWVEVWDRATNTVKKVKKDDITTTTTTTRQEGTATREKPHVSAWAEACKGKTSGIGIDSTGKKWDCSRKKDWKPEDEQETKDLLREDVDVQTEKDPEQCECQTYKADGSKGPMVKHPCGQPNPNCTPPTTTTRCTCTDPQGKQHAYDCDKENCNECPKPKICEGETGPCNLTKAEIRAKQKECADRGTRMSRELKERWWFSLKTCQCESKRGKIQNRLDDAKELIANCPRPKFNKKGSFIGCEGSDGGYAPKFTTEMN